MERRKGPKGRHKRAMIRNASFGIRLENSPRIVPVFIPKNHPLCPFSRRKIPRKVDFNQCLHGQKNGANGRIRTVDHRITNAKLCQLSYVGFIGGESAKSVRRRQDFSALPREKSGRKRPSPDVPVSPGLPEQPATPRLVASPVSALHGNAEIAHVPKIGLENGSVCGRMRRKPMAEGLKERMRV